MSAVFAELEKLVPVERKEEWLRYVAYVSKHEPTDEIGLICHAAGWLAKITSETPEAFAREAAIFKKDLDERLKTIRGVADHVARTTTAANEQARHAQRCFEEATKLVNAPITEQTKYQIKAEVSQIIQSSSAEIDKLDKRVKGLNTALYEASKFADQKAVALQKTINSIDIATSKFVDAETILKRRNLWENVLGFVILLAISVGITSFVLWLYFDAKANNKIAEYKTYNNIVDKGLKVTAVKDGLWLIQGIKIYQSSSKNFIDESDCFVIFDPDHKLDKK